MRAGCMDFWGDGCAAKFWTVAGVLCFCGVRVG